MKKTAILKMKLICDVCDEKIITCDECGLQFDLGDTIFCSEIGYGGHFCENCSNEEGTVILGDKE